jgi:hypothetical protein
MFRGTQRAIAAEMLGPPRRMVQVEDELTQRNNHMLSWTGGPNIQRS